MHIGCEWLNVKDARLLSVEDDWEKYKSFILRNAEKYESTKEEEGEVRKVNGGMRK